MKQSILSLRNAFLFFLTVFLLNLPGAVMAGSAAQIASQVEILQDTSRSSQERSAAAQELGVVGLDSDAAAQALVEVIENDSDPKVRASAAKALGMVGLPQAAYIQTLIQTLQNDGSPAVRYAAAEGLRLIGVDSASAKQALKNAAENDSNAEVRRMASKVYNQITSTN
jgi:HEAT repeat protein